MKKIVDHLKENWIRHGFETLVVIVGVLIAFALNNWNEERLERAEEVATLTRVLADIRIDLEQFDFRIESVEAKEESLLRVKIALSEGVSSDIHSFLKDVIIGADFGWNQGLAQRSTYDDLLGSGKLGIIKNPNIRFKIANYYRYFEEQHTRMDERETAYPHISYQLVPRGVVAKGESEVDAESGLSEKQLTELVTLIQKSPLKDYITGEINLARFIRGITLDLQNQAIVLADLLEEYHKEIQ